MKTLRLLAPLALAGCLAATPFARAHAVWLEDLAGSLVIRFGEPGEAHEKSPGLLDQLTPPVAWTKGTEGKTAQLAVTKQADHFLVAGAAPSAPAFAETSYPVYGGEKSPATKPFYYLRWLPAGPAAAETVPVSVLDLVPAGDPLAFRVVFRGQPLPGAKVHFHAPGEKEIELVADAAGLIRTPATKPGLIMLSVHHTEDTAGWSLGRAYMRTTHLASVAWRQP